MYVSPVSEDDDFEWLKALHAELWPPKGTKPRDLLSYGEVKRICALIVEHRLITELFPYGPICGIGMAIYAHEVFPGTGACKLLCLQEGHLKGPEPLTWHEHIMGKTATRVPETKGGDCDQYAWVLFNKFAKRPENIEWLKQYKLQPNKDKVYYDY